MQAVVSTIDLIYRYVFFAICHPNHLHQPALGNNPFPLCYRETGIFVGFLVGFVLLAVMYPRRPSELPRRWFFAAIVASFLLMTVDGIGSYARLGFTNNATRLGTGLLVGFALSSFVVPVLNGVLWRHASFHHVLTEPRKIAYFAGAVPVTFAATWFHPIDLGYLMPHIAIASVLLLLACVNLYAIASTPLFEKVERGIAPLAPWLAAAVGLSLIELAVLALAHATMHA